MIEEFGYDVKFGYHVVRLLGEVEQILATGDLDLERDREVLKAIRRGEWSLSKIKEWFAERENGLQTLYENSQLPHTPDEEKIKTLLLSCLEEHYGSLSACIVIPDKATQAIHDIKAILEKHGF